MAADEADDARIAREIQEADARAFRQAQHQAAAPGGTASRARAPEHPPAVWPCFVVPIAVIVAMHASAEAADAWTVYAILAAAALVSYELVQVRRLLSRRS